MLLLAAASAATSLAVVEAGSAQLPSVPVPKVEVPSLPSVPAVPAPVPEPPSLPAPGSTGGLPGLGGVAPGGGGSRVVPGAAIPGAPTQMNGTGVGGVAVTGSVGSAVASVGARGSGSGQARSKRKAAAQRRAAARRRQENRFRERVERHAPCFYVLTRQQRRVLRMRAGLGKRRAHHRSQVARRLDLSVRRVRRLERAGLALLEGADSISGCAIGGTPARSLTEAAAEAIDGVPYLVTVAAGTDTMAGVMTAEPGARRDRGAVAAARASSVSEGPDTDGPPQAAALTPDPAQDSAGPPLLLLLALAALALGGLLALGRRRQLAPIGAAAAEEEAPEQRDQAIEHAFVDELMKSNPHVTAARAPEEPAATNGGAKREQPAGGSKNGQGVIARALQRLLGPKV